MKGYKSANQQKREFKMIIATSHTYRDIPFNVRIVFPGEMYGKDNSIKNDGGPLVEFYDARHAFDKAPNGRVLGQFISRYDLETMLDAAKEEIGISLDGGIPEWTINAEGMKPVYSALRKLQKIVEPNTVYLSAREIGLA